MTSDLPADYAERLNIRDQIARIDRAIEESAKFRAEQAKLNAEAVKLAAEQTKLNSEAAKLTAEAAKFRRDRFLAPILAAGALGGFVAAILPLILRGWGIR